MSTELNRNNESKTTERSEQEINLIDIVQMFKRNWHWFALSVFLCGSIAFLYLKSTPKVYIRKASVLIREDSKSGGGLSESSAFADLSFFGGKRNVDNELLIFQTRHLMEEVVRRLRLDMSYKIKSGLRLDELYTQSPVSVSFPEVEASQAVTVTVTSIDSTKVLLSDLSLYVSGNVIHFGESIETVLGDTIETSAGTIVVTPTLYYTENYFGTPVYVTKSNMENTVEAYQAKFKASFASKMATIIDLTLQDVSIARAEDILNLIIAVYNEDAVKDKNQITVNTSSFIDERLKIIERELGNVDSDIESFKRSNQLTDITSETGMYLQTTSRYQQEGVNLENQLSVAKYIKEYLTENKLETDGGAVY